MPIAGHAIECRIYAEDPDHDFIPSPGKILDMREPSGPGVRVDSAVYGGGEISIYYDPMIAKLITWGADRAAALGIMRRALEEYRIVGPKTNIAFHQAVLNHPDFAKGHYDTHFIEHHMAALRQAAHHGGDEAAILLAAILELEKTARPAAVAAEPTAAIGVPGAGTSWRIAGRREGLR